ncbi:hypothetical protein [Rhodohalobacter sp. SW132]|uniref:hypothetical protein n=1 Tax=Rhodohalobacter sp. SW132 TaxID=2293433 RepID=UPI001314CE89|nr:hypothetical protein [Rhodohalobacter sp. SW132]
MIIETSLSDDELFDTISETLIREGHRIERDRELMSINTEGRDIGLTTYVRYNLLIADGTVTGRVDWMSESHSKSNSGVYWREAKWTAGRSARAFASLTDLLLQFEHETFRFK